jgi:hypothetical protein
VKFVGLIFIPRPLAARTRRQAAMLLRLRRTFTDERIFCALEKTGNRRRDVGNKDGFARVTSSHKR